MPNSSHDSSHFGHDWMNVVYNDLRSIATAHLSSERAEHTLRPTDLVHEAWLRFRGYDRITLKGRGHFLSLASQSMRRVLIDHARRRTAAKRGGGEFTVELSDQIAGLSAEEFLELNQALVRLKTIDAGLVGIVELRYFGGARTAEIAEAYGISERTVRNRLAYARSWLREELD